MTTAYTFVQATSQERESQHLRPFGEFHLMWVTYYLPSGKVLVAHDDAGNSYAVTEEAGDEDFPLLLTITPPPAGRNPRTGRCREPLYLRCGWHAEAASYAEDFNWNRTIGYVANGHVMGIITTSWYWK